MMRTERRAKALAAMVCVTALTAAVAAGCADKTPWGVGTNIPEAAATADGVAFSLLANNYTADLRYFGPTQGDSVSVALAAVGVRQGDATVVISDSLGTILMVQDIVSDTVRAPTYLHGKPPYHVRLEFLGYTGVLSVGVGVKAP
ncbi:MAG: hypothetical protein ABSB58_07110 [Gemmatimonadales bacterium]|jgi:hypothetical protein